MATFDKGHALVIGVGEYDLPSLRTPQTAPGGPRITVADAQGIAKALLDPNVCAYPPNQVTLLTDDQTTRQGIIKALQQLAQQVGPDDTAVIFFCGHGAAGDDGDYYLGTRDVQVVGNKFKGGTGLSKTDLLKLLRNIQAQKLLLIINACFSGNIGGTLGPGDESLGVVGTPPSQEMRLQVLGTGEGRAIITASRSNQYSRFDPTKPNTYFGQALIDALEGKNIPDTQYIGLYEMYQAVYQTVKADAAGANPIQEPVLTILDQVGPFPVALSGKTGGPGTLGPSEPLAQEPPSGMAVERVTPDQVKQAFQGNQISQSRAGRDMVHGGVTFSGGTQTFGGDLISGDKVTYGDEVRGDKVFGDKVQGDKFGGDKISVGNITGSTGVGIGRNANINVTQGIGGKDLNQLFQTIYQDIDARKDDPDVDKDELKSTVQLIQQEAAKGDQANGTKVQRWLQNLGQIAPDILQVTAATLLNPVAGVATALQKIAQRVSQQSGS